MPDYVSDVNVRKSKRAKHVRLVVRANREIELVVPSGLTLSRDVTRQLIERKADWISNQLEKFRQQPKKKRLHHPGISRAAVRKRTKEFAEDFISQIRQEYSFHINKIRYGDYVSQWGSCSSYGNISLHECLSLLPKRLAKYVVAHELAHLRHPNHSSDFWEFVEQLHADAKACRKELKRYTPRR